MKTILKGAVWVFVAVIGAAAGFIVDRNYFQSKVGPTDPPDVTAPAPHTVQALGSIQPQGGIVEVAVPAGLRPLRLEVELKERVNKGQVLAELDGYDERQREVEVIDSEVLAAEAARKREDANEQAALEDIEREREKTRHLGKMLIRSLDLKIQGLEQKYRLARGEVQRVEGLERNNTIARQQYEQLQAQRDISRDEWEYARAERARTREELELTTSDETVRRQKDQVRFASERARAQYPLETLKRKKELAVAAMARCTVVAPIEGQVLEISTHAGESATGKPLLKLGNTRRLYVLAEVYEDERKNVQVGQKAEIKGRGLPLNEKPSLRGTVQRISPMVGSHKQSPLDPTYRENSRVYEVWIQLDEEEPDETKDLRQFILQPVEVTISPDSGHPAGSVAERHP
jgi:HlyD family secretion protein